jgi:hypothetical protein
MKWLLVFMTISFLAPTTALATKGPCTDDRLKFCKETTADPGAIRFCLLQHKDELSGACEARLQEEPNKVDRTESGN